MKNYQTERMVCNNMNVEPEKIAGTLDCTPSWESAVGMWFFAIMQHTAKSGYKVVTEAEKELKRLAVNHASQAELIKELTTERDEARERFDSVWNDLDGLDTFEIGDIEYHDKDYVREIKQIMFDQIKEWEPRPDEDSPAQELF